MLARQTRAGTCRLPLSELGGGRECGVLRSWRPGALAAPVRGPALLPYRANKHTQFIRKQESVRVAVRRIPLTGVLHTSHAPMPNSRYPRARLLQEQVCSLMSHLPRPTAHAPDSWNAPQMHARVRAHPWVTSTPSGRCCARDWSRGLSVAMLTSAWRAWAAWQPRPPRRQPRRRRWRGPA